MKRITALLLALLLVFGVVSALAETWTCPNCGKTGNDGMFCPSCGTPKSGSTSIQPGDYVYLGRWEQNDYAGDGAERIRWIVLAVDGSKLLLLSEKGLANIPFHKKSDGTSWAGSYIRQWLNYDFYRGAFSAQEAAGILTTEVQDTVEHCYPDLNTASRFSGTSEDKVFLLSYLELCQYCSMQTAMCEPSASVRKANRNILTGKYNGNAYCYWWLRTSAYKNNAMFMSPDGFASAYEHHTGLCARPALWADASVVTQ